MISTVLDKAFDAYARLSLANKVPTDNNSGQPGAEFISRAQCLHKAVVATLPKAGTYLVAKFLLLQGLRHIDIHLSYDGGHVDDYRSLSPEDARSNPKKGRVRLTPRELAALIHRLKPGDFYVGHCGYLPQYTVPLNGVKTIFSFRELRSAMTSFINHLVSSGRMQYPNQHLWNKLPAGPERTFLALQEFAPRFIEIANGVSGWKRQPNVLHFSFEDISGRNGTKAQFTVAKSLVQFLDLDRSDKEIIDALKEVTGTSTRTHYPQNNILPDVWCDKCEDLFKQLGGDDANLRLVDAAEPATIHSA